MRRSDRSPFAHARALPLFATWIALALPGQAGVGDPENGEDALGKEVSKTVQETAPAQPNAFREALVGGDWWIKLRLRYENVDQDGFSKDAHALTLRTVLGYETAAWHGFSAQLEFEDVTAIPNDNSYDSTINGETDRPVVADPVSTEVNQAFLRYRHEGTVNALFGRQRILLDNQRFVGNVGWRQNEQTFDAASGEFDLPLELTGLLAYLENANRVVGEQSPGGDARMGSGLFHLEREFEGWGKLSLYDYYLDFDSAPFTDFSTNSFGGRFAGAHGLGGELDLTYAVELAHQTDVGDNPEDVDASYYLGELGARAGSVSGGLGWEVLGGDGTTSFQTPLATLHAFNGWADKFLVTPPDGLEDLYVQIAVKIAKGNLKAVYHDFTANEGGDDYGSEIDLVFTWPLTADLTFGLKYADYSAEDYATDTRKAWAWLQTSL